MVWRHDLWLERCKLARDTKGKLEKPQVIVAT